MKTENLWNMKVTVIPVVNSMLGTGTKIDTWILGLGNKKMIVDHPKYCIINRPEYSEES